MASPFELIEGVKRSRLVCVVANTAERKNEKKVVAIQPFFVYRVFFGAD